jgi:hypothetical protein
MQTDPILGSGRLLGALVSQSIGHREILFAVCVWSGSDEYRLVVTVLLKVVSHSESEVVK